MIFNSFEFAIFLALCLAPYLALQWAGYPRAQNRLLLFASYAFYAAWDWRFCFLIALSTLVDFQVARAMFATNDARRRRALLGASLAVNLGALGYFKYANFFAESFCELFLLLGFEVPSFALDVVLPVGISFYTFQTLSYTVDVYRKTLEP
ncbi:MAG: alginate O-acetyltransferase complex protein AlgI, partial [Myxococcota bacterium]